MWRYLFHDLFINIYLIYLSDLVLPSLLKVKVEVGQGMCPQLLCPCVWYKERGLSGFWPYHMNCFERYQIAMWYGLIATVFKGYYFYGRIKVTNYNWLLFKYLILGWWQYCKYVLYPIISYWKDLTFLKDLESFNGENQ